MQGKSPPIARTPQKIEIHDYFQTPTDCSKNVCKAPIEKHIYQTLGIIYKQIPNSGCGKPERNGHLSFTHKTPLMVGHISITAGTWIHFYNYRSMSIFIRISLSVLGMHLHV
jgi:hypothetical protein